MPGVVAWSIPTNRRMIGQNGPLRKVVDANRCSETIRAGIAASPPSKSSRQV